MSRPSNSATRNQSSGRSTEATERPRAWARVYPALKRTHSKVLRHGTWYPVLKDEREDRLTIRIGTRMVDVPRRLLEVRATRPTFFSVITRVGDNEPPAGVELGRRYAVCPNCSHRIPLAGEPTTKKCPKCEHVGEIAWWEA